MTPGLRAILCTAVSSAVQRHDFSKQNPDQPKSANRQHRQKKKAEDTIGGHYCAVFADVTNDNNGANMASRMYNIEVRMLSSVPCFGPLDRLRASPNFSSGAVATVVALMWFGS